MEPTWPANLTGSFFEREASRSSERIRIQVGGREAIGALPLAAYHDWPAAICATVVPWTDLLPSGSL
jgi:hypothetical protein